MKIEYFLDTNVLIYAAQGKRNDPRKHAIAMDLLRGKECGFSGQVLAEFSYQTTKAGKGRTPLSEKVIGQWFSFFSEAVVAPIDYEIVRAGVLNARRYKISYWDGAIIAAAERLGAPILYTEDLKHNETYGSVQVINPFRPN
jgi:predicted nucleic acid-binding protein